MEIQGLDRIAIMVRDMDRAIDFFSNKLGMKFKELEKKISVRDGVECRICHSTQLELITPLLPLPKNAAPPMKKNVEMLKEREMIFIGLIFKVEDPRHMCDTLRNAGIGVQFCYEPSHDYASLGMDNFTQCVAEEKDTFGITMAFGKYDYVE
jgi:extradiol dioxygenase family protein